ncbi:ATP-binding protein [Parabacteroides segnis]|uniref:ATP-binding protein n=1 Tax=Parabacteroides segnis TaxID=2763058 RepID=UPI003516F35D
MNMTNNPRTLRSLQLKMITGYAVIISLFLLVLFFIYKEKKKQDLTVIQTGELQTQRQLADNAAVQILGLALLGEQMLAWEEEEFALYSQKRDTLTTLLHRLRGQLPDNTQRKRINAIIELLPLKEKYIFATLDNLQKLRDTYTILQKRIPTIIRANKKQQEKLTQEIRKNYEGDRKKTGGFLGLFRSTKKSRYLTERENHAALLNNQSQTDIRLRSLANEIDRTRLENMERLFIHMDSLNTLNTRLNQQMCRLITDFNRTSQVIQKQAADTYWQGQQRGLKSISGLGLCAVLLAFVFYLLLQKDLKKRHKIRMELERSNQKNEALSLSRKNILLTVNHDLRAPLNTINGYAELIAGETDENQRNSYAENIRRASQYMVGLANNLLYYYRLEAGKEQTGKELFHPGREIAGIVQAFRPPAEKKGLGLTVGLADTDTVVEGDRTRLGQILNNLLANAVKFTRTGYIHVGARYGEGRLCFFVRDTGAGISPERQKGIFTAFEREEAAATQPGFGLGLSITAKLVALLDGQISVESMPGHGSTFNVCLPMPEADRQETGNIPPKEHSTLSGMRVVLIDDDRMQADVTKRMLARTGVTCDCCHSVKELIGLLRCNRYDLLLTDMQMPDADGNRILALLRNSNLGQSKDIPVAAVTARTDKTPEYFAEAGFAGFLHKPFSLDELLAVVARCTGGKARECREVDFTGLLEGEKDRKEMLGLFIQDTENAVADLHEAIQKEDYRKISALVHKGAPLWETIRIGIPAAELERLASLPPEAWSKAMDEEIRELEKAVELAVEAARRLWEEAG